ncbi:hypothetical protein COU37_05945 [Candidatus Micrarchaeota archaeon CG10_big_fil_rev_8_21_14_0_10_45_29]|nr:MAG: hypothetical protein COU37_05945 [Candidatus Micrarchaeota archaeon CG10_big_fil_rev_8_21_14_0_10_45_29]
MALSNILKQKTFFMLVCANVALSFLFAASTGTEYLEGALNQLCCDLQNLIPVSAMLLVIAAGVIYSAGQMFGAETRARANVWATSCLTGAIIGIIISQVAPCVLGQIAGLGTCITCDC